MKELAQNRAKVVLEALQTAGVDEDRLETGPVRAVAKQKEEHISAEIAIVPLQAQGATTQQTGRDVAAQNTR